MSAIPAASVNLKTMADGTLRVSFDIEPAQAQDAFRLFAAPGTPVAIAALQVGYAAVKATSCDDILITEQGQKPKIGPLGLWLVQRCKDPDFWQWLNADLSYTVGSEDQAADAVKHILGVTSRKDVDGNPEAEACFHSYIRKPFQAWLAKGKK